MGAKRRVRFKMCHKRVCRFRWVLTRSHTKREAGGAGRDERVRGLVARRDIHADNRESGLRPQTGSNRAAPGQRHAIKHAGIRAQRLFARLGFRPTMLEMMRELEPPAP